MDDDLTKEALADGDVKWGGFMQCHCGKREEACMRLLCKTALTCAALWWLGDMALQVAATAWRMW